MDDRYDIVVVGAGSAGAVLAARLSEDPTRRVLLLEAGPDHASADTPPSIAGPSFHDAVAEPGRVWPGLSARLTAGRPARQYLRGRGVGGSSAVNAMLAVRGHPTDYDEWGRDWAWDVVAPWFDRIAVPLHTAPAGERGPLSTAVLEAAAEVEGAVPEVGLLTRSTAGRRQSVNDAYLEPARSRSNLTICGDALVDAVLLEGRTARGVRLAGGREIEAPTVIVSSGTIHSPGVLVRSGVDLPGVGVGLQEHPSFPIAVRLREGFVPDGHSLAVSVYCRGSHRVADDLQLLPVDVADPASPGVAMLLAALMRVESRGVVRVTSSDPHVDPEIDFDMLSDERDVEGLQAAIELADRVLACPAITRVAEIEGLDDLDRSGVALRAHVGDYVHATSTCRMGSAADESSVVDERCRVHHHDGLWVCDASVLPRVPRANTHMSVMMVAERVAAMVSESTSNPATSSP